jgi:Kef-type K+ transport system membrane component KefB
MVVAIGMLPRGEVGLIFAGTGRALEVIDADVFSALVITIIFSTVVAPAALKWAFDRAELPRRPG